MIELGHNRYGKSAIRLVKVTRGEDGHRVRDLTVAIALEGDFRSAHVDGDNALVVATDTMKNTVYALAPEYLTGAIEDFGLVLARHFLEFPQVSGVSVSIDEHLWSPISLGKGRGVAPDAFTRGGTRTCEVAGPADALAVRAGIRDAVVMKTTKSGFSGFPRDRFTTLREVDDRLLATKLTAVWRYGPGVTDFEAAFAAAQETLYRSFAEHHSPSVQASIWIIGRAMLEAHPEIVEVHMRLPNLHHWLVDLAPFGLPNDGEIFVATEQPYGLIEATVRRG